MNTMTIHADDVYAAALRAYAAKVGKSISQTVQILTAPSLGLSSATAEAENPFLDLCGVLPKGGGSDLKTRLAAHRSVDNEARAGGPCGF